MKRLALCALGLLGACTTPPPAPPALPGPQPVSVDTIAARPDTHPQVPGLAVTSAAPRRLSLDQLEAAIDAVGNLPPGTYRLPASLAVTLGRPDYSRVTEENLQPGVLFVKFLGDIAAQACTALSDAEPTRPRQERLMTRFDSREANLAFLLLRFTGLEGAEAEGYLARLRAVYDAAGTARPRAGYEAVCMALFTSPEFLLY